MINKLKFFAIFLFLFLLLPKSILAQEEILEGRVVNILKEDVVTQAGQQNLYQQLKVEITRGSLKDNKITVEVGDIPIVGQQKYKTGDQVLVSYSHDLEGNEIFFLTEFVRRQWLGWLFLIFVLLAILIGRWRGLSSLVSLGFSFLIIFKFILPQIYAGQDPVLTAVLGSLLIIPLTFYLSHGLNKKTTVAVLSTLIALVITGFLAKFFVQVARLTGYASEEAAFLQYARQGAVDIKGLLLAGIIIGTLGILDDITVAQAAIVQQLKQANKKMKPKELFSQAMRVGQDHIASMINTLILVYTGAALPLLLLFIDNPLPFSQVINYEIIAEEIIRTLVGSIGLITAVPITTFLASRVKLA
ncbi:MAG TPA: YibE/F family protein [Nevskiaceae bacterium]|nr:YibE/F family protein [Nevskiaceae bacterium]